MQIATLLILVLAANTSFADFPRLASFHAGDNFMPKQLTTRGHRLVFSNGILALAAAASVLVVITGAQVSKLIPLYAIGVFTSFTLSQAGMTKHHWTKREQGWRKGMVINGIGCVLSFVVDIVIAVTKFTQGAWFIIILVPVMVALLVRLNRQYEAEAEELEHEARAAAAAPVLRRHVVIVAVDKLDNSAARAIQYARALVPDELRAVHAAVDMRAADELAQEWTRLGLSRVPLEIVECADRRVPRSVAEAVAQELADGDTEVTVLVPQRQYRRRWHQLLHDNTSKHIVEALAGLPHANVTIVPYQLSAHAARRVLTADAVPSTPTPHRTTAHRVRARCTHDVPTALARPRPRAVLAARRRDERGDEPGAAHDLPLRADRGDATAHARGRHRQGHVGPRATARRRADARRDDRRRNRATRGDVPRPAPHRRHRARSQDRGGGCDRRGPRPRPDAEPHISPVVDQAV